MNIVSEVFKKLDWYLANYYHDIVKSGIVLDFNNNNSNAEITKSAMMEWSKINDVDVYFNNDMNKIRVTKFKPNAGGHRWQA